MKILKRLSSDAPLTACTLSFLQSSSTEELRESFEKEYALRLEELFNEFLAEKTLNELERKQPGFLGRKVEELGLHHSIVLRLHFASVDYIYQVMQYSEKELTLIRGIGAGSAKKIVEALQKKGYIIGA